MKKNIVVVFGGVSPEHEVSVITGLQVVENIDRTIFNVYAIKLGQDGQFYYYKNLKNRKNLKKLKPSLVFFSKDIKGAFFSTRSIIKTKIYIDSVYLCFHGGGGESGEVQGFFDTLGVAYTSPNVEGSAISMNKVLTKEILTLNKIPNVPWVRFFDYEIKEDVNSVIKNIKIKFTLPVILKPAHFGSSIGVKVAKNEIELKKYLLESSYLDSEILIEKFIFKFREFNVSIRKINNKIECSQIEMPLSKNQILSFADKYQRGGKKRGGMASLNRQLPAKITGRLKNKILKIGIKIYKIFRLKGMVRIDFMYSSEGRLYVTEINPIPGSMAFYLWEASGILFKDQITDLLNQSMIDYQNKIKKVFSYSSDIVEKFIDHQ